MGTYERFSELLEKVRFYCDDFNGLMNVEEDDEYIIVETLFPNDWLTSFVNFFRLERIRNETETRSKYWLKKLT